MKKFITLCVSILSFMAMSAETCETLSDFAFLKGQSSMNYVVDWSDLTINSLPADEWIAARNAAQPSYNAKNELENELKPKVLNLIEKANAKLLNSAFVIVKKDGCKYTLIIRPQNLDQKGKGIVNFDVINSDTKDVLLSFSISSKGWMVGTMSNMWGESFKFIGKELGTKIAEGLK